jgi:hypothetical protein
MSIDEELLELRLRVAALEREVEAAREVVAASALGDREPLPRRWWLPDRVRRWERRVRPDGLAAAGLDATGALRVPVCGWHLEGDAPRFHDGLQVDGVRLGGLLLDAPGAVRARLVARRGLRFQAFAALRPPAWVVNDGGVRFNARVLDGDRELARTSVLVDPAGDPAARRWVPLALDVGTAARDGQEVVLELRTELPDGASGSYAWSVWGNPVLLLGAPRIPIARLATSRARRPVRAAASTLAEPPIVSILLPVHDPDPALLRRTLDSVRAQTSDRWQLCVCDDGSGDPKVHQLLAGLEVVRHDTAQGISAATNSALRLARGEFVATLDHDDVLHPEAIAAVTERLAAEPDLDVLYTDNDKTTASGRRFSPALKPGWSPDLLRALMYTLHLGVYRRSLVESVGGWRTPFDGAQDWDLVLRLAERTDRIGHLPRVLHSWTAHAGSASLTAEVKPEAAEAGRRAVAEHLGRTGVPARAEAPAPGRTRVVFESAPALQVVRSGQQPPAAGFVLLLEEDAEPATEGWGTEMAGHLAAGAAAVGAWVVDRAGRTVHAGVAHPRGVPLPVHPGTTQAEELTFVTNRAALTGVVALRAEALRPGEDLLATTLRLRGRKVLTPHARFVVHGTPRGTLLDPAALRAIGNLGPDPLYNPQLWPDRASHVVPRWMG